MGQRQPRLGARKQLTYASTWDEEPDISRRKGYVGRRCTGFTPPYASLRES